MCQETCSRQIAGRWRQHHASGPTSQSTRRLVHMHTCTHAHTHRREQLLYMVMECSALVTHHHPESPGCLLAKPEIAPCLWGEMSHVWGAAEHVPPHLLYPEHIHVLYGQIRQLMYVLHSQDAFTAAAKWSWTHLHWQWKQRCLG